MNRIGTALTKKHLAMLLAALLLAYSAFSFAAAQSDGGSTAVTEDVYGEQPPGTGDGSDEPTVTSNVYDESGLWVTQADLAVFEPAAGGVTLSGKDAIAAYAPKKFKDEAFSFTLNASLENGAWPAVALRMDNYATPIWHDNAGYLIVFKAEKLEIQKFGEKGYYKELPNAGIVGSGTDHQVRVGAVDIEGGVKLTLIVDGKLVYEWEDTDHPVLNEGFFGLYAMAGMPATVKQFTIHEERRANGWVTSAPAAVLEPLANGVTLSGSDAIAAYEKKQYRNATYEFTFNADLQETWPAVALRMDNYDTPIWTRNSGYLIVFKAGMFEVQRFGATHYIKELPNPGLFNDGTDHRVKVGAVDVEGGVKITLAVDGKPIHEWIDSENPIYDEGYFGLYAMAGKPAAVKNLVIREERRANGWVTSVETASLESVEGGVTLSGNGAIAAYDLKKFRNETFTFDFNADLENTWPAVAMRMDNYDTEIWNRNSGYLVVFKSDKIEVQRFGAAHHIAELPNPGIVNSGTDHKIQLSSADVAGGVKLTLKVDGALVYEWVDSEHPILNDGYLGLYAMAGKPVSIKNLRFGKENDPFTKGPLEDLKFTDVTEATPFRDSIHFLTYTKVVPNEATTFEPELTVSADDFVRMAVTAMCHTVSQPCDGLTGAAAIDKAVQAGLIADGELPSEDPIRYGDAIDMLTRALTYSEIDAAEAEQFANAIPGAGDDSTLTRAQTAELLMRFMHVY
ncbi:hypothetical protein FE782_07660 [Paenibacillus antri]|uniref:S-layer homology domain-containing protein n=1 Tax=Paenibacillus antri TaxID=2582848 RepID=A0A5R9GDQ0_9BACL|nr:hypothetical protein [Paenibacillus antri]TLS53229.1 hypothetical protein FE782_07660 [Paenibacillus antri]